MRAERTAPEPKGEQIILSVFIGELFAIEGVKLNLALARVNLAELISPAIGWSLGIAITGAEAGESPVLFAEIAVTAYCAPVSRPKTEHVPRELRFVGAAKQFTVWVVVGFAGFGPVTVAAYCVTAASP
jgi:hypothetical protein